jgi:Type II secretion system (T2SS), protein M
MTTRDRLMLMGLVAMAMLLAVWFMAVAPERERASKIAAEVQAARQQLASAETQETSAHSARAGYSTAYASLISLGLAVPATAETPALIYMLDKATHRRNVQFTSIASSTAGSSGASATPSAKAPSTGFSQQTFTFVFSGSFVDLNKLFNQLEGFTVQTSSGPLQVSGRLLTINGVSLTPDASEEHGSSQAGSSQTPTGRLTGTITATAYVLPAGQSALGGATATGPSGAPGAGAPSTSSTGPSTSGTVTPAVVKVNP